MHPLVICLFCGVLVIFLAKIIDLLTDIRKLLADKKDKN